MKATYDLNTMNHNAVSEERFKAIVCDDFLTSLCGLLLKPAYI